MSKESKSNIFRKAFVALYGQNQANKILDFQFIYSDGDFKRNFPQRYKVLERQMTTCFAVSCVSWMFIFYGIRFLSSRAFKSSSKFQLIAMLFGCSSSIIGSGFVLGEEIANFGTKSYFNKVLIERKNHYIEVNDQEFQEHLKVLEENYGISKQKQLSHLIEQLKVCEK